MFGRDDRIRTCGYRLRCPIFSLVFSRAKSTAAQSLFLAVSSTGRARKRSPRPSLRSGRTQNFVHYQHKEIRGIHFCGCPLFGRDDRIRTCGLFVPNEARYQTALHLDSESYEIVGKIECASFRTKLPFAVPEIRTSRCRSANFDRGSSSQTSLLSVPHKCETFIAPLFLLSPKSRLFGGPMNFARCIVRRTRSQPLTAKLRYISIALLL